MPCFLGRSRGATEMREDEGEADEEFGDQDAALFGMQSLGCRVGGSASGTVTAFLERAVCGIVGCFGFVEAQLGVLSKSWGEALQLGEPRRECFGKPNTLATGGC